MQLKGKKQKNHMLMYDVVRSDPCKICNHLIDDARFRIYDLQFKIFITFSGEKANVTRAFAPKFTSTAILSPRPLRRKGKISDIMSQPIGPNEI